mgnify:CR=1 FL=1
MAEEQQDNSSFIETDLDVAAKKWEKELTSESGEDELPTDEDNQLTQEESGEELEADSEDDEEDLVREGPPRSDEHAGRPLGHDRLHCPQGPRFRRWCGLIEPRPPRTLSRIARYLHPNSVGHVNHRAGRCR